MRKTLFVLISLIFLVTACAPGQSPEEVQAQIETAVAQTMAAQQQIDNAVALTVAAQNGGAAGQPAAGDSTSTPTATPTNTPLSFPTLTPLPTVTPIPPSGGGGGGGGGTYKAEYSCDIIRARPYDNSEFGRGQEFDIKWTILNTGTRTWEAGYDVKYFSGPQMTSVTVVEIPVKMKPGDTYEIILDANAPNEKGFQVMTWTVQGQICYPYVAIIVK